MRLSVWDAVLYALMVGAGEAFFLANAIRLGASTLELGLLVTLPLCLGAAGPATALRVLAVLRSRKPFVVGAALAQAVVLLALAIGEWAHASSVTWLIAASCLYQVCGQAAGTSWGSWFGDLVPVEVRGRYFSRRTRAAHAATLTGLLAGGLVLQRLESQPAILTAGGGQGFAILFAAAGTFRLVSVLLLAATAEPRFQGLPGRSGVARFLAGKRGGQARRVLLLGALLQLVVYVASPYFQPYMLEELTFGYLEYTVACAVVIAAKMAFLPGWGRGIDQFGARPIATAAPALLALVPLPWLFADGLGWVLVAQVLSGFSWAGYEVGHFSLLLETTYRKTRVHAFAALSALNGCAQLLGGVIGALITLAAGDVRTVFAVSLVARLAVAACFVRWLPTPHGQPHVRRRDLILRVIGLRASGGVVHRPLQEPGDRE